MSRLPRIVAAAVALWLFLWPSASPAADANQQIDAMMAEFHPAIRSLPEGRSFLIAAGSFFDPATGRREELCLDIEATLFEELLRGYGLAGRAVIVDWKRPSPMTPSPADSSGSVRYPLTEPIRRLAEIHGRGYLITGFAAAATDGVRIHAELVEIPEGTVARRFGPPLAGRPASVGSVEHPPMRDAPAAEASAPAASATDLPAPAPTGVETKEAAIPAAAATAGAAAVPEPAGAAAHPSVSPGPQAQRASDAETGPLSSTVIEGKNFRYEGQIDADGRKHGHGTLVFDSGDSYTGQWEADRMNGEGTYAFSDGDRYVGQWRDNKMHGRGTYHYASGDRYTGQFANDVKDGPGTYYFKNGDRWEGSYLDGRKHGNAVYTWKNGQTREEMWNQGQKVQ